MTTTLPTTALAVEIPATYTVPLSVTCGSCTTTDRREYTVPADLTTAERTEFVARVHLRREGWSCTPDGDYCPACQNRAYITTRLHTGSSDDCPACTAQCETPETHNWGCPCAPHGPRAARQVATLIAAAGEHSHLSADGETVCLSGICPVTPIIDIAHITRGPAR